MPQLVQVGKLMGPARSGSRGVQPVVYNPAATTIFNAMVSGGDTPTTRRKYTINRCVNRLQAAGLWDKISYLWVAGLTENDWKINWRNPGTKDLTKVSTPSYTGNTGFTTDANTKYYDTGVALTDLAQDDFSMWLYCPYSSSATGSTNFDMGTVDGSAIGVGICTADASNLLRARAFSLSVTLGASNNWGPAGAFHMISRSSPGSFDASHFGIVQVTSATASSTPGSAPNIRIGGSGGSTNVSARRIGLAGMGKGLTATEQANLAAILKSTFDAFNTGEALIEDVGYGTANISADVAVYGLTPAAICTAFRLKALGRSVVLLGGWNDAYPTDIGGMPANGLQWVDAKVISTISGFFRDLITWANGFIGVTDSATQNGCSIRAMLWNMACKRALDPTRTGTFTGQDIPVYMTGGLLSVTKADNGDGSFRITGATTVDGRTITALVVGQDYDGDMLPLAGIPYTMGAEAAGSGNESLNGFQGITGAYLPLDDTGSLRIDPYVTPGVPASGLLPDTVALPALSAGAADPILQALNCRLAITTNAGVRAPVTGGGPTLAAPPGYNAARYEVFGRLFAAATLAGHTVSITTLLTLSQPISQVAQRYDCNNGSAGLSTDVPQSGEAYLQAGLNYAARRAVFNDVKTYMRGLFYWILASGDSRIQAATITAFQAYGLSADQFLDAELLYWPNQVYPREPIYQMNNSGFKWTAADVWTVDGTAPRSVKTIGCISYNADKHAPRRVAYDDGGGMAIWIPGGFGVAGGTGGPCGTDKINPVPMEVMMPDKAVCTNYLTSTHPSMTKVAFSAYRLEPAEGLAAEGLAYIIDYALTNNCAVQDVDYSAVRTAFLAAPVGVTPVLPLVN